MVYRILCASDGSQHASQAIQYASDLAKRMGGELTIAAVNVVKGGVRGPVIHAWDDAAGKTLLDKAAAQARAAGTGTVKEVLLQSREVSAAIVRYAEENKFDHIVTGTGDNKGVSRLILGSVAADIARSAHCSVTIVR
jgi:nucleotide-binding universal stress UspA family protein